MTEIKNLKEVVNRVKAEQYEWSLENFGRHPAADPALGLIEELGELSHAILKQRQNIRGSSEEHDAAAKDAVGDMAIYLLDVVSSISSQIVRPLETPHSTVPVFFLSTSVGALAMHVGQNNFSSVPQIAELILNALNTYCLQRGWSFAEILDETWAQVKQRNWKKNPQNGASEQVLAFPATESAAMTPTPEV